VGGWVGGWVEGREEEGVNGALMRAVLEVAARERQVATQIADSSVRWAGRRKLRSIDGGEEGETVVGRAMVKAMSMAKNGEDIDGDGDGGQLLVAVMAMVSNYRRPRILHSTAASSVRSATQALHCHRCWPWLQIEDPPHSLHVERRLPCLQMYAPPQSRHCCRSRPWLQIETPEQSLQRDFCRPWLQKVEPPHSLHADRRLP
jgi:hypothetical protein